MFSLLKNSKEMLDAVGSVKSDEITGIGYWIDEQSKVFTGISLKLKSGRKLEVFLIETPDGTPGIEWEVTKE
jgi:hypothetical protein